ncbi:hypothetical protein O6H91_Y177200 [Diphasiastrum complanatum]|nr:hypothetical protein O6H91_Y177200 [Diphasiastrum complanatum]
MEPARTSDWRMRLLFFFVVLLMGELTPAAYSNLTSDFYNVSCPTMEAIIEEVAKAKFKAVGSIVTATTLRLYFHDCIIRGCDASVLISSTPDNKAERDAEENLSLGGDALDMVFKAKAAVEMQCPGVVSCADILAVATRDLVAMVGGPRWNVTKGRRDGRISLAADAERGLPGADFHVDQLTKTFTDHNLSRTDMIALSGAHSLGFTHCDQIYGRLYNFSGKPGLTDPSINTTFAKTLKQQCPQNASSSDPSIVIALDPSTPFLFDNAYYQNLREGRGCLTSDQTLFNDTRTRNSVITFSQNQTAFFRAFVAAIGKMGNIGVLTGTQGEIRKDCATINSN